MSPTPIDSTADDIVARPGPARRSLRARGFTTTLVAAAALALAGAGYAAAQIARAALFSGKWWGTKWGTKPYVAQPISAESDLPDLA